MPNSPKPRPERDDVAEALRALTSALEKIGDVGERMELIGAVRSSVHALSPNAGQPVDFVRWVPIEKVKPNDYNPNSVAKVEMGLLYRSIWADGYTQPVVTVYDPEHDTYVIVDGFHRYFTALTNADVLQRNNGLLPVVVLEKTMNERMAATVRHNRARGSHSVDGMANMVYKMLDEGWADADICNELGMEPEELLRLKHITGFSKLFENAEYRKAWVSRTQAKETKKWRDAGCPD